MATLIGSANNLGYYLERVSTFLDSGKKTLSFPSITSQLENVLVKIVAEGPRFLIGEQYNDNVKEQAAKLTFKMEEISYKSIKLIHDYVHTEDGQRVLRYKKETIIIAMANETFKAPKPLRKPNEVLSASSTVVDNGVTQAFKARCLNDSNKFVKDDSVLVNRYSAMSAEQAQFLMQMLAQGKKGDAHETDLGYGFRSIYAPLYESMQLKSAKFEYKISCETCNNDTAKKIVTFEKVPHKPTSNNDVIKADPPPGIDISSDTSKTMRSTTPVLHSSATPKKSQKKTKLSDKQKKINKLIKFLQQYLNERKLTQKFMEDSLRKVNNFMTREEEGSIIFDKVSPFESYFLQNVERIFKIEETYMLFSSEAQQCLGNIKYVWLNKVLYTISFKKYFKGCKLTEITFTKQPVFANNPAKKVETEQKKKAIKIDQITNAIDIPAKSIRVEDRLQSMKKIINRVTLSKGVHYIQNTLQEISDFLSKANPNPSLVFDRVTSDQYLFLKYVHVLSKTEAAYEMFARESQQLLTTIKTRAKNYDIRFFVTTVDDVFETLANISVTIMKKSPNETGEQKQEQNKGSLIKDFSDLYLACRKQMENKDCDDYKEPTRSRSLTTSRKQKKVKKARGSSAQRPTPALVKLMEGLAQPVKSDKALKIMQSMGWKGGALGLRGEGITEPIALSLDRGKRAGFGAPKQETKSDKVKPKKSAQVPSQSLGGQIIQANVIKKEPGDPVTKKSDLLPEGVLPLCMLPTSLLPPEIHPPGLDPSIYKTVLLDGDIRTSALKNILELVSSQIEALKLVYYTQKTKPEEITSILKHIVAQLNYRRDLGLGDNNHANIANKILNVMGKKPVMKLDTIVVSDGQGMVIRKLGCKSKDRKKNKSSLIPIVKRIDIQKKPTSQEWYKEVKIKEKVSPEPMAANIQATKEIVIYNTNDIVTAQIALLKPIENPILMSKIKLQGDTEHIETKESYEPVEIDSTETPNCKEISTEKSIAIERQPSQDWYEEKVSPEPMEANIQATKEIVIDNTNDIVTAQIALLQPIENTKLIPKIKLHEEMLTVSDSEHIETNKTYEPVEIDSTETPICKEVSTEHTYKQHEIEVNVVSVKAIQLETKQAITTNNVQQNETTDYLNQEELTMNTGKKDKVEINHIEIQNILEDNTKTQNPLHSTVETQKETLNKISIHNNTISKYKEEQTGKQIITKTRNTQTLLPIETKKTLDTTDEIQHPQSKITHTQNVKDRTTIQCIGGNTETEYNQNEIVKTNAQESLKLENLGRSITNINSSNFKYFILIRILDFCNSKETFKAIKVKDNVSQTMMAYAYVFISVLNIRSELSEPGVEKDMVKRIISAMSGYDLKVDFDPPKTILLYKVSPEATNNNSTDQNMNILTPAIKVDGAIANLQNFVDNTTNTKNCMQNVNEINFTACNMQIDKNYDETKINNIADTEMIVIDDKSKQNTGKRHAAKPNDIDAPIVKPYIENHIEIVDKAENAPNGKNNPVADCATTKTCSPNNKDTVGYLNIVHNDDVQVVSNNTHKNIDDVDDVIDNNKVKGYDNTKKVKHIHTSTNDDISEYEVNGSQNLMNDSDCQIEIDSDDENILLVSDAETETSDKTSVAKANEVVGRLKIEELDNALNLLDNIITNDILHTEVKVEKDELDLASQVSSFRKRTSFGSINEDLTIKKCKVQTDFTKLCIRHKDYPQVKIDHVKAGLIQTTILKMIDYSKSHLPALSCQGIHNGGLIYNCHDENSNLFLQECIKTMDDFSFYFESDAKEKLLHKVAFRINSYIEEDVIRILNRLELHNVGLDATSWSVIKKEQYLDFIVIYVEIDDVSFRYVRDANFVLYAGNDCARFTIIWD